MRHDLSSVAVTEWHKARTEMKTYSPHYVGISKTGLIDLTHRGVDETGKTERPAWLMTRTYARSWQSSKRYSHAGRLRESARRLARPAIACKQSSARRRMKVTSPRVSCNILLPDICSVRIFVALCRKNGIRPYRYPRQRRTTVMVRVRQSSFEQTVGKEFRILHRELTGYFNETVEHLIADAMKSYGDDETLEQRRLPG